MRALRLGGAGGMLSAVSDRAKARAPAFSAGGPWAAGATSSERCWRGWAPGMSRRDQHRAADRRALPSRATGLGLLLRSASLRSLLTTRSGTVECDLLAW